MGETEHAKFVADRSLNKKMYQTLYTVAWKN